MLNNQPEFVELQYMDEKGKLHTIGTARVDSFFVNGEKIDSRMLLSIFKQLKLS